MLQEQLKEAEQQTRSCQAKLNEKINQFKRKYGDK